MSFGALISHKKFQHDSSTPSWSKFAIKFTMGITIRNKPKNRLTISDGPSANLRPLFNSNVTKVSFIKLSQNLIRTIRSGVFGIAKNVKITCFACISQIFGYAKNTDVHVRIF